MRRMLRELLSDDRHRLSSKRTVAIAAFLCLVGLAISNGLTDHKLSDHLVDAFAAIVMAGVFGALAERFGKQEPKE